MALGEASVLLPMMNFPEPPDDITLTGASGVRSVLLPIVYIQGARARKEDANSSVEKHSSTAHKKLSGQ